MTNLLMNNYFRMVNWFLTTFVNFSSFRKVYMLHFYISDSTNIGMDNVQLYTLKLEIYMLVIIFTGNRV
jgi:hypothetical protein